MISIKSKFNGYLTKMPEFVNNLISKILVKSGIVVNYQPMLDKTPSRRLCTDRLQVIKKNIVSGEFCLDIGCNTGYFSYEIAKLGIFTVGMDSKSKNIIVARSQYIAPNLVFKQFKLDKNSVKLLPCADVILFLSIFHHLVKYYGGNDAVIILKELTRKCNKYFFFETGQLNEEGTDWAEKMNFLGDVTTWVHNFFIHDCGYKTAELLGEFTTSLTPTRRKLFLASR